MKKELENHIQMENYFVQMYKAADKAGDKEAMELFRNKHNAQEEEIKAKGNGYCWLYRAMQNATVRGNELPDFYDVIWEKDIPMYVEAMKENEVTEFTVSSGMTSMAEIISAFLENGCKLKGMATVKSNNEEPDFSDKKIRFVRKYVPAFLLEIK